MRMAPAKSYANPSRLPRRPIYEHEATESPIGAACGYADILNIQICGRVVASAQRFVDVWDDAATGLAASLPEQTLGLLRNHRRNRFAV